jgi:hypothetical protein
MNEQLEKMFNSLLNSQVPVMWSKVSYPSLKTLGPWVKDLCLRVAFMEVKMLSDTAFLHNCERQGLLKTPLDCVI